MFHTRNATFRFEDFKSLSRANENVRSIEQSLFGVRRVHILNIFSPRCFYFRAIETHSELFETVGPPDFVISIQYSRYESVDYSFVIKYHRSVYYMAYQEALFQVFRFGNV